MPVLPNDLVAIGWLAVAAPLLALAAGWLTYTLRVPQLFTPGVNVYFGPLNRFMLNYDIWSGDGGSANAQSVPSGLRIGESE